MCSFKNTEIIILVLFWSLKFSISNYMTQRKTITYQLWALQLGLWVQTKPGSYPGFRCEYNLWFQWGFIYLSDHPALL